MDYTKIAYVFLVIVIFLLSSIADKKNSKFFLYLIYVLLSLYAGLRDVSVGIDTDYYYRYCTSFEDGGLVYIKDPYFMLLLEYLMKIFRTPTLVILFFSFIIIYGIVNRLWGLKRYSSFPFAMLIFMCCFYLETLNIMRQYIALSIIFWGTRYLDGNKYLKFLICLVAALLFHMSSIVCALMVPFHYMLTDSKKSYWFYGIFFLVLSILLLISSYFYNTYYSLYEHYFENEKEGAVGLMNVYKLLAFGFVVLTGKHLFVMDKNRVLGVGSTFFSEIRWYYVVGILFTFVGYFFNFMDRIALYYLFFETLFWGRVVLRTKNKILYTVIALFFMTYSIAFSLYKNGDGVFPYSFIH